METEVLIPYSKGLAAVCYPVTFESSQNALKLGNNIIHE
jgi:hypothetical protein